MACRATVILGIAVLLASVLCSAQSIKTESKTVLSKQVGDLFLQIKECARTGDTADNTTPDFPIRCGGSIENKSDIKLRVEFTNGKVIDDAGNEYKLWNSGPWGGVVANFSLGAGCCAEELIPGLPLKFAFWVDHVKREATLVNPVLDLTSSGNPSHTEIIFKGVAIRGH